MIVNIPKECFEALSESARKTLNLDSVHFKFENKVRRSLKGISSKAAKAIYKELSGIKGRKTATLTQAFRLLAEPPSNVGSEKPRTVDQFTHLITEYIRTSPGYRVFYNKEDFTFAYYVYHISVQGGKSSDDPPYTQVRVASIHFGHVTTGSVNFYFSDVRGKTIAQALLDKGYCLETPELRSQYLEQLEKFSELVDRVGTQCYATGTGLDRCDGNDKSDDYYRWMTNDIDFDGREHRSRVLVDVFYEKKEKSGHQNLNVTFWNDRADDDDYDDDVDEADKALPEVPVHPMLAVFDMLTHMRVAVHVSQLEVYQYNTELYKKLVLEDEVRFLIQMMLRHREVKFKDLVAGKSGGAVVLLSGPPGVGKTLTAEAYAESEQMPLYSVQCAQLGTCPEDLEKSLMKVFERTRRWGAILLIDEADVYVRARESDLNQNAIVGVFLRVMEYQSQVLFLTTNRPNDIDDAIASRCLARLNYTVPSAENQRKIWRVLADSTGAIISDETISQITQVFPNLSGRDIKCLLKLSMLVKLNTEIDLVTVQYMYQFRPVGKL